MGRKKDRIWMHVEKLKDDRFKCTFCGRVFSGGATRIKYHLAGDKGNDIEICTKVPEEVQEEASLMMVNPTKNLRVHQLQTRINWRGKSDQLQYQRMTCLAECLKR